ncbi:type IV toxin-antitoxin system AbiEi family antitoxin [Brevibacterium moorei]|uniref:type IV toxin-antitoxin system AbiEi family antitoxin n=1 Tax=Brevibacterium moorei TaxID=2968457 RepID=UPI00211C47B3|nr:type IV toxin-antitoxin system AbiEi family antitoxin [Brevibacterium sp. 68QC2CO]MCQ9386996.1 type IV toxin-antitoxin system AbiEi family antitoxin [Brevibacterium sp. 68QC2CO]
MTLSDALPPDQATFTGDELIALRGHWRWSELQVETTRAGLVKVGSGYMRRNAGLIQVISELHIPVDQIGWRTAAYMHGAMPEPPRPVEVVSHHTHTRTMIGGREPLMQARTRPADACRPAAPIPGSHGIPVTTCELTIADLISDQPDGWIDTVGTVERLAEGGIDVAAIARMLDAQRHADAIARRLGWLLDRWGLDSSPLRRLLVPGNRNPSLLIRGGRSIGIVDSKWELRVNTPK